MFDGLFHQVVHFAHCVGNGLAESPLRPVADSIVTLTAMDTARAQLGVVFNEER